MSHPAQCDCRNARPAARTAYFALAAFAVAILLSPLNARAQEAPPNAIGQVTGPDLTVDSGSAAGSSLPSSAPSIFVLPGSVVTVHSGQAQMKFFSGGHIDICGPAKFTVLESGGAVTLALNFGKMHIQLPGATSLRIYTPTIIATPLEIGGGARDVTIGLDLQDSLCVHPATGALQLESQFSGEKIIVPENSEFFLAGGRLLPVAGTPGSCQCVAAEAAATPPPVPPAVAAVSTKPIPLPPPKPGQFASSAQPDAPAIDAPPATYAVPVETPATPPKPAESANAHRAAAPAPATASAAANSSPVYSVSKPALSFTAPTGLAPTQPSVETLMLVTQARVQPEYEFRGVVAPDFAAEMQNALGEKSAGSGAATTGATTGAPEVAPQKKKGGFWHRLFHPF